jgi:hypothetical protein
MEISDLRRRVRAAIEEGRRTGQERRARAEQAGREYEVFLRDVAVPVFQGVAAALSAEGYRFKVFTPAESVRLASDTRPEDYIEVALDAAADPPVVIGRSNHGRGRRLVTMERPVKEGAGEVSALKEEDVVAFLLAEIVGFVER